MTRRLLVISVIVILSFSAAACLIVHKWGEETKEMIARCVGYDPAWEGIIDCYGVISIWGSDDATYTISYNAEASLYLAKIKSADGFILNGNQIYVIDIRVPSICNNLISGKYCGDFRVNGKLREFYYDGADQVPKYIILDTQTGNERFYARMSDIPVAERPIFQQLSNRHNGDESDILRLFVI